MPRRSNYDKFPFVPVTDREEDCQVGWAAIARQLDVALTGKRSILCVECYPGTNLDELESGLASALKPRIVVRAESCLKSPGELDSILAPYLGGDDPVFGRMNGVTLRDFLDPQKVDDARNLIHASAAEDGRILVLGTGAALIAEHFDLLVYADMARWELTLRQRRGQIGNLGAGNLSEVANLKYKRAFFVDWRAADRLKKELLPKIDYLLDTNARETPKLVSGKLFGSGLAKASMRPFRVVPYFDPGVWGGHWMEEVCDLPKDQPTMPGALIAFQRKTACCLASDRGVWRFLPLIWCFRIRESCWAMPCTGCSARSFRSGSIFWTPWAAETSRCRFIRSPNTSRTSLG